MFHAFPLVFRPSNIDKQGLDVNTPKDDNLLENEREKTILDDIDSIKTDNDDKSNGCKLVICRPSPFNMCYCNDDIEKTRNSEEFLLKRIGFN